MLKFRHQESNSKPTFTAQQQRPKTSFSPNLIQHPLHQNLVISAIKIIPKKVNVELQQKKFYLENNQRPFYRPFTQNSIQKIVLKN